MLKGHRCRPAVALAWVFTAVGCHDLFSPMAEGDVLFSIHGYLDASAEVQWFRVMPIRPLIPTSSDPLDVEVRLVHLDTGESTVMADSVMALHEPSSELGGDPLYIHNFYSVYPVVPGGSYRLEVTRADGARATATMSVPLDFSEFVVGVLPPQPNPTGRDWDYIRLPASVEHLAFVEVIHHLRSDCIRNAPTITVGGPFTPGSTNGLPVPMTKFISSDLVPCAVTQKSAGKRWELRITATGGPWPAAGTVSSTGGPAIRPPNLVNAVGFAGGTLTKVVPYETCVLLDVFTFPPPPRPPHCELTYDASSARLFGTIQGSCGDLLEDARLQLTEIVAPGQPRRRRPLWTDVDGEYEIGAIDPYKPYVLDVWHPEPIGPGAGPKWEEQADTVTFAPGEQVERHIVLRQWTPC